MVMATNGTLLTPEIAEKIRSSGIQRVSISLDGATAEEHDRFRQVQGAYQSSLKGIGILKEAGVEFQINTTITKHNYHRCREILDSVIRLGAVAHHLFLLVPTGRAREMADQEIDASGIRETSPLVLRNAEEGSDSPQGHLRTALLQDSSAGSPQERGEGGLSNLWFGRGHTRLFGGYFLLFYLLRRGRSALRVSRAEVRKILKRNLSKRSGPILRFSTGCAIFPLSRGNAGDASM